MHTPHDCAEYKGTFTHCSTPARSALPVPACSYEVSRSLQACEGALLVVDASQGIEAQTLANVYLAIENELEIIPVINKIDLPAAEPERVKREIEEVIGIDTSNALMCSAKEGIGIDEILAAIVAKVPPPPDRRNRPLRALIFDSYYDQYLGVICQFRVMDGLMTKRDTIKFMNTGKSTGVGDLWVRAPGRVDVDCLYAGEVGCVAGQVKAVQVRPLAVPSVYSIYTDGVLLVCPLSTRIAYIGASPRACACQRTPCARACAHVAKLLCLCSATCSLSPHAITAPHGRRHHHAHTWHIDPLYMHFLVQDARVRHTSTLSSSLPTHTLKLSCRCRTRASATPSPSAPSPATSRRCRATRRPSPRSSAACSPRTPTASRSCGRRSASCSSTTRRCSLSRR